MIVDVILSRLEKVKRTGAGTWIARCPAHDDRSPSLSIRETGDGRVLLHCFAGCDVSEVLSAMGLSLGDLFPDSFEHSTRRGERRPFPAADVLRCIAFEAVIVVMAAASLRAGEALTPERFERLVAACGRIQKACAMAGVSHG
ncbi:MAG: hypothetical protein LBF61_02265 [Azoarcus sp.]|jgi:hypothetical protein|nr:hypothetical protein [Azoarcus sp.]